MVAGGLWHGSSGHMLLWGGLHGVYLIIERVLNLRRDASPMAAQPMFRQVVSGLVVFVLGCWALVAFRCNTSVAFSWWWTMLRGAAGGVPDGRVLWYITLSVWLDWIERRHGAETTFDHWPVLARTALLAGAMLLWFLMTRTQPSEPFIYRGF